MAQTPEESFNLALNHLDEWLLRLTSRPTGLNCRRLDFTALKLALWRRLFN